MYTRGTFFSVMTRRWNKTTHNQKRKTQ